MGNLEYVKVAATEMFDKDFDDRPGKSVGRMWVEDWLGRISAIISQNFQTEFVWKKGQQAYG